MQAKGQDIGNLLAVILLMVSGYRYYKGSYSAALVWLGTLLYLIYAYIVYGMAVHLNGLFLVYVAALGLSVFAVLMNVNVLKSRFGKTPAASVRKLAGYTLTTIGVLFAFLWLGELIPALISGIVPQSIVDAGLIVNPIHVMDLAVVLPAFILAGYLTLKNVLNGLFFVGPWLVFSALMATSIVAAMVLIGMDEGFTKILPPFVIVSVVAVMSLLAGWRYLREVSR